MVLTNLAKPTVELDWKEEFIEVPRIPRTGWKSLEGLLSACRHAEIFLKEEKTYTDITLRFPSSSQQLPPEVQNAYSGLGMDMSAVFAEVILKSPPKGSSTLWSELMRVGYKAYRETWLHSQKLRYLDHCHPKVDEYLKEELKGFRNATSLRVGRRHAVDGEQKALRRRFRQLCGVATEIHGIVQKGVQNNLSIQTIRRAVCHKIRGKRIDDFVLRTDFSNLSAFKRIRYEKRGRIVCLHDPSSWKPRQLAKALLSLERECTYETIERKTAISRLQRKFTKNNRNK